MNIEEKRMVAIMLEMIIFVVVLFIFGYLNYKSIVSRSNAVVERIVSKRSANRGSISKSSVNKRPVNKRSVNKS